MLVYYPIHAIICTLGVNITFDSTTYSVEEEDTGMTSTVDVCLSVVPPPGPQGLERNVLVTLTTDEDTAASADFEPLDVTLTFTPSNVKFQYNKSFSMPLTL